MCSFYVLRKAAQVLASTLFDITHGLQTALICSGPLAVLKASAVFRLRSLIKVVAMNICSNG